MVWKVFRGGTDLTTVLWGVLMHLLVLWGVLDVNFHSPIIPNLSPVPFPKGAPAKRAFIFVADGVRFRTFDYISPAYLSKIVYQQGVSAISHTRVPTESRPGNIAIASGFYEDPSAIFKGWKENPVNFDSVFNQSRVTFAWGSPDIIPIFTKGGRDNIKGESYPANWQDFGQSTIKLDEWVFDKFFTWLKNDAEKYKTQDKVIVFFHLLGCDTAGHASKPKSKEYIQNIRYVDRMIEKVVQSTETFFEPGTTSYLFTSDHGMTDWGSHGSGSTDETETPFVGWGAGFNIDPIRKNIEQVDIAPLVSSLIGTPIPVNNEGVLPRNLLNYEDKEYGAYSYLTNAKQLAIQVTANRIMSIGMSSTSINWREEKLNDKINEAENLLIQGNKTEESLKEGQEAMLMAKEYLSYFRRYYRNVFLACLMVTWLCWIGLLALKSFGKPALEDRSSVKLLNNLVAVIVMVFLLLEHFISGYQSYRWLGYGSVSVFSFWYLVRTYTKISITVFGNKLTSESVIGSVGVAGLTAIMFFGLTHRWILSLGMLLATAMQYYFLRTKRHFTLLFSGICLAVFPLLPVVEPKTRIYTVLLSILVALAVTVFKRDLALPLKSILTARLVLTMIVCSEILDGRAWISWLILFSTPFIIPMFPKELRRRIEGIALISFCPLALLSASYEPIFYSVLAVHLSSWPLPLYLDGSKKESPRLNLEDFLSASYLILYTLLSFFGTGNMASISSFDPSWTRNFVTVFSPFTMTGLIVFKIVTPMILVGCICRALASSSVLRCALMLGDCIALFLMNQVTPYGSWLEIGSAISRFTIAIILYCLLMLLHSVSYHLLTWTYKTQFWELFNKNVKQQDFKK